MQPPAPNPGATTSTNTSDANPESKPKAPAPPQQPKYKLPPSAASVQQTFIIVTVNDRLGGKTQVPCLASDTIGDFKKLVAARIGRDASKIRIQRQGQRPFKNHLTLEDYEVSNGVQLDLELGM